MKALSLLLTTILALVLLACESEGIQKETVALGDTVATDVLEFSLKDGAFTFAVDNAFGPQCFLPREYDPHQFSLDEIGFRAPHTALAGDTLTALTYEVHNISSETITFDGPGNAQFISVRYNGIDYPEETTYGFQVIDGMKTGGILYEKPSVTLLPNETITLRCYVDIPVEVRDLSDGFTVTFFLPTSGNQTYNYSFQVPGANEGRIAAAAAAALLPTA